MPNESQPSSPTDSTSSTADKALPSKESFAKRVLIAASLSIGLFAGVMLLWYSLQVLLIIFAGVLFAILLRQCAIFLANHSRLSEKWSLAVVVLIIVLLFGGVGYVVAPRIAQQGQELYTALPKAYDQAKSWAAKYPLGQAALNTLPSSAGQSGGHSNLIGNITGAASITVSAALTLLLILFLGLYLAAEPQLYIDGFTRLFAHEYRGHVCDIMSAVGKALAGWLVGQGVDMAFIGVMTALGLWAIGVPLAFTLGLLAALANFIPNFGPIIAFIPSALLALTISPHKVVEVGILFVIVQGIEGYILQPTIQRRTVALPPALTILAQVLLGLLLGPMGVVLATPLMASALVLVKVLYVRDVLHDPVPVDGAPPVPHGGSTVRPANTQNKS